MSCHSSGSLEGGYPSLAEVIEDTEDFIQLQGLQMASVANGKCCKLQVLQIASVANCKSCNLQVLHIVNVANCKCCKLQVLRFASVANCKCCCKVVSNIASAKCNFKLGYAQTHLRTHGQMDRWAS